MGGIMMDGWGYVEQGRWPLGYTETGPPRPALQTPDRQTAAARGLERRRRQPGLDPFLHERCGRPFSLSASPAPPSPRST
jgi:hypothetical protein